MGIVIVPGLATLAAAAVVEAVAVCLELFDADKIFRLLSSGMGNKSYCRDIVWMTLLAQKKMFARTADGTKPEAQTLRAVEEVGVSKCEPSVTEEKTQSF